MNNQKLFRGVGVIYKYHRLNQASQRSWRLRLKPICASTEIELSNWLAAEPLKKDQPKAIFAFSQKFGKGQFGRHWYSPKGGVWVSAAIKREFPCQNNSELYGLAVALSLAERIEKIGINVKIKWPNDLLVDDKKLAGILPRLFFRGGELRLFRVGIGLNVLNNIPKEAISLKKIIGEKNININFWSSEVLLSIERSLDYLDNKKFLCSQVEKKLWSKKYIDKDTGHQWDIKGIDLKGRLLLFKEGKEKIVSN